GDRGDEPRVDAREREETRGPGALLCGAREARVEDRGRRAGERRARDGEGHALGKPAQTFGRDALLVEGGRDGIGRGFGRTLHVWGKTLPSGAAFGQRVRAVVDV